VYKNQGKLEKALEYYNRAVTIYEKTGKQSIEWAFTLNNIGVVYYYQRKLE